MKTYVIINLMIFIRSDGMFYIDLLIDSFCEMGRIYYTLLLLSTHTVLHFEESKF